MRIGRKNRALRNPRNRLRELRLLRGLTLQHVASAIGVEASTLHQAETENTGIGWNKWMALADFFGVDPRSLRPSAEKSSREVTANA